MKKILPIPSLLLGLALATAPLQAETLVVLPGTSIQAKIDEAADGDIIAIFGGTYAENLTVNKAVRFAEVQNQDVTFLGNITIEGVENPPPLQGLTFAGNKALYFQDTTGSIIIRDCEFTEGGNLNLDPLSGTILMEGDTYNANVRIGSRSSKATLNNVTVGAASRDTKIEIGAWGNNRDPELRDNHVTEVRNCRINRVEHVSGSLYVADTVIRRSEEVWQGRSENSREHHAIKGEWSEGRKVVLFRVSVEGFCSFRSKKVWIGYSKFEGYVRLLGSTGEMCPYVFVGNEIDNRDNTQASALGIYGDKVSALVANNKIWRQRGSGNDGMTDNNCISVFRPSHPTIIHNNFLSHQTEGDFPYSIRLHDSGDYNKVKVFNNVIYNDHGTAISAGFGATFEGNHVFSDRLRITGGIVIDTAKNFLHDRSEDPGFVGWAGDHNQAAPNAADVYTLTEDSRLRNAGSANPLYNDRDGSRNDAGPSGGAWYDPEGWTTDKPVVISFDLDKEVVLEGADTEVIISGGTAVSAP